MAHKIRDDLSLKDVYLTGEGRAPAKGELFLYTTKVYEATSPSSVMRAIVRINEQPPTQTIHAIFKDLPPREEWVEAIPQPHYET